MGPPATLSVRLTAFGRMTKGRDEVRYTGVPGSTACHLTGDNVVVATVSAPVSVPIPMFGASFTIVAAYRAAPVLGGLRPVA